MEEVKAWNIGDKVIVQVPQPDETFDTFVGTVEGILEDGFIDVFPTKANSGSIHCKPEWVYPEDWLS